MKTPTRKQLAAVIAAAREELLENDGSMRSPRYVAELEEAIAQCQQAILALPALLKALKDMRDNPTIRRSIPDGYLVQIYQALKKAGVQP